MIEGRKTFEAALGDPDSLADLPVVEVPENEQYGYVAMELFEAADAGELKRDFATKGAEPAGTPWEEDDVYALFPRLAAKYD